MTLLDESRAALELLSRAIAKLEPFGGGGGELLKVVERVRGQLSREELVVELYGPGRAAAVEALTGVTIAGAEPAAGVQVRLRAGLDLGFRAAWRDGRLEVAPLDETPTRMSQLATIEQQIVAATERARALAEGLQEAARSATHARARLAEVEHDLGALRNAPAPPKKNGVPPAAPAAPERRSWLRRFFAWLLRLFVVPKEPPPALPPAPPAPPPAPAVEEESLPALPATDSDQVTIPVSRVDVEAIEDTLVASSPRGMAVLEKRVAEEAERLAPVAQAVDSLEGPLKAAKARLMALNAERERRRRELESYQSERRRRILARLQELTERPSALQLELTAPGVPPGMMLAIHPIEPHDARVETAYEGREALCEKLERLRSERSLLVARGALAALRGCRSRIQEIDERAQKAHQERLRELAGCRVGARETLRQRELGAAQRPVSRDAEKIVQDAAELLEKLMEKARADWAERIESTTSIEQLRGEVAAIESGAAHRLSLLCDELRESMTIEFVRLVLALSRGLRQELLRRRLEVARGQSAQLDETFEDIRVVLPASLDETFAALRAPGVGALLDAGRSVFDPLFRTLAREKRQCASRLSARLDEVARTSARELFAASVYVSPILLSTYGSLVDELVGAHETWIDARVAEEERDYAAARVRLALALEMTAGLEACERRMTTVLEG
jgi:hypothetical protein